MASKSGLPLRGPGFEVEPPDKANFRSIGRGNGGVIKKRIPVYIKDVDPATPSSMPTKYQTVLYRKNREKRGFSCSTTRTAQTRAMAEVVPGPGAYAGDLVIQELEESTKTSTSTSASVSSQVALRGRGTFASRTPRLVHPSKQHGYVPPGPGTYIMRDVQRDSSPTAAFSLPGPGNPAKFNVVETEPGPASYLGPDDAVPPIGCQGARAVFGSSPRATQQVRDPDLPGPGQYDQIDGEERLRSTRPSQKQLSPRPEPMTDLETLKLRRGAEILNSNTTEEVTVSSPGPGQYTPRLDAVRGPKQFNARGHSSFHIGNSHIPRKWRQPGPGPTDYVPPIGQARPRDAPWPLSTLASSSERFAKQQGSGAPGPAFYSPKHEPGAVSFHLNMQHTWV
ncbi:stpg1 [Symbiodinium sp. CCMP2456]|nr:stpg1 [Symbiodinium sp. CCMP2456]